MNKKILCLSLGLCLAMAKDGLAQFSPNCLTNSIDISTGVDHSIAALYPTSPSSTAPVLDHYWQISSVQSNTTGLYAPNCAQMFLTSLGSLYWTNSPTYAWIGVVAYPMDVNTAQLSPTGNFFWNCPPSTPYAPTADPTIFTRSFYVQSGSPSETITVNIPSFWGDDLGQIYLDGTTPIYTILTTSTTGGVAVTPVVLSVSPGMHTIDVKLWDVSGQGTGIKLSGTITSVNNVLVGNNCFGASDSNCIVTAPVTCNANFTGTITLHTSPVNSVTGLPYSIPDRSIQLELDNIDPSATYWVNYGDGTGLHPYVGAPAYYTYSSPGSYQVCITEIERSGDSCTSCYDFCIGKSVSYFKVSSHPEMRKASIINQASMTDNKVAIVPNPTHGNASVQMQLSAKNNVHIVLIDMTGKQVASIFDGQANEGAQKFTIDTESLSAGIYQVQIMIGTESITEKLSVNK